MKTRLIIGALVTAATLASPPVVLAASQTFVFTGSEQTYTVPAGTTSLLVEAKGAAGGNFFFRTGGRGASVVGNVDVTPGQTLYVEVGDVGQCNGAGLPGVGMAGGAAGGGGATDLRPVSVTHADGSLCAGISGVQSGTSLNSRLIVAAGGGGAGTTFAGPDAPEPSGGDAGQPGVGEAGGSSGGPAGRLGVGGPGASWSCFCPVLAGGGGGGGLYGGGGGGTASYPSAFGGGGGGGSSLAPPGGSFEITSDPAQLKITPRFRLSIGATGDGSGYVQSTPGGIDCGQNSDGHADCAASFAEGSSVTLKAHPAPGSAFDGFSAEGCSGAFLTCQLTVAQAATVQASFSTIPVPKTKIKGRPKYSQSADTRFRFRSSIQGSKFKCKLDAGKYKRCRSPKNFKNLRPGKHAFYVYAIGPEGTVDESPAKVKFKVRRRR